MGKSIGIISIKGGVGKTFSTISLGDALSSLGKKVLLVDGNFSAPNLGIHLNVINPESTIHDVLSRSANFHEAIHTFENFDILPAGIFSLKKFNPFDLRKRLNTLKRKYDFIIIDSSPALNEETLAAMLASDEIFIVTTPDYSTLGMTLKAIKMAKQRGTKINGIILNKVYNRNFELSIKDIEDTVEVPVLAVIPHDINVLRSSFNFTPLTTYKPNSNASREYRRLAGALVGEKQNNFNLRNLFNLTPKRHEINREIFYRSYFG